MGLRIDLLDQRGGLLTGGVRCLKERIQGWQHFYCAQAHFAGRVLGTAPATAKQTRLNSMAAQQLSPALRLLTTELIEVALSTAIIQLKIRRITRAGRCGMAQQQHGAAFTQRGPGVLIAGLDCAAEKA